MRQTVVTRKALLLRLGLSSLGLFMLLRLINVYGDQIPWAIQKETLFTVLSFVNVSKYPPSLMYCLLMLGIMFLLLWITDRADNTFTRWLIVYGKVPLFYYLVHWYVVHLVMIAMVLLQGYQWTDIIPGTLSFGRPPGAGLLLGPTYLVWMGIVVGLYPFCRWYGRFKEDNPHMGLLRYI